MSAERDIAFQAPVEESIAMELARKIGGAIKPNPRGKDVAKDFVLYQAIPIEVKCDYKSKQTRNIFLEVFNCYRQQPSGLTATKAKVWVIYTPGDAVFYTFHPNKMLQWLLNESHIQKITACGDRNSDGYCVPIKTLAALPFVKTYPFML